MRPFIGKTLEIKVTDHNIFAHVKSDISFKYAIEVDIETNHYIHFIRNECHYAQKWNFARALLSEYLCQII